MTICVITLSASDDCIVRTDRPQLQKKASLCHNRTCLTREASRDVPIPTNCKSNSNPNPHESPHKQGCGIVKRCLYAFLSCKIAIAYSLNELLDEWMNGTKNTAPSSSTYRPTAIAACAYLRG